MAIAAGVHQTWWREFFKKLYPVHASRPFNPRDLNHSQNAFRRWSKTSSTLRRNEIALPDNPNYSFALLLSQRLSFHLQDPEKQCPPLT
jgi:hypothetical protein